MTITIDTIGTATLNRDLFADLPAGTVIQATRGYSESDGSDRYGRRLIEVERRYVWVGAYEVTNGHRSHAKLVEYEGRSVRLARLDTARQFNLVPSETDPQEAQRVSSYERFLLGCIIQDDLGDRQNAERFAKLEARNTALLNDIRTINRIANEEADERSWCESYEEVIDTINAELKCEDAKLVGREREWTLDGKVVVTYDVTMTVKATSKEQAIDLLRDKYEYESDDLKALGREQDSWPNVELECEWDEVEQS